MMNSKPLNVIFLWRAGAVLVVVTVAVTIIMLLRVFLQPQWAGSPNLNCECDFIQPLVVETRVSINRSAWAPDGSMIAFDKASMTSRGAFVLSDTSEIYVIAPDGKDLQQLTEDDIADWEPTWSPDSKSIVFASMQGTQFSLRRVDVQTKQVTPLFNCSGHCRSPVWSPDGRWIAFRSTQPDSSSEIWLLDIETRQAHILYSLALVTDGMAWSPDSKELAFPVSIGGGSHILSLMVDGSGANWTWPLEGDVIYPAWSNISSVAFVRSDGANDMVFISDIVGTTPWPLIDQQVAPDNSVTSPAFSPDGTKLTFIYGGNLLSELYIATLPMMR